MPIRINLLAEAQAAEEIRRRDPAKRAIWVAIALVIAVLFWSSLLQAKIISVGSNLNNRVSKSDGLTKQYTAAMDDLKKLHDAQDRLKALSRFETNRFFQATVLDMVAHAVDPDIQIIHLRTEQAGEVIPEVKASKTEDGKAIPGRPASAAERIRLIIDAKDSSSNPGDEEITKYIRTLAATPYFQAHKISTNNIQMRLTGNLQIDAESGKPYVPFSLECLYPAQAR